MDGAKYFFYKTPNGEWKGSATRQAMYSRTFMPKGTQIKEAPTKEILMSVLKTDKVPLKEANLSKETIAELDKAKVPYEKDIEPIEKPKIGGEAKDNT